MYTESINQDVSHNNPENPWISSAAIRTLELGIEINVRDQSRESSSTEVPCSSLFRVGHVDFWCVQKDEVEFAQLVNQWHQEIGITSSISRIVTCPSYLRIIAMGKLALPLILNDLRLHRDDPDFWFVALEAITGEDPVPDEACGDSVKMAEAWLAYAELNGW